MSLIVCFRAGTYIQIKMRRHKANESLRPGKPRSHADIFGIEGSFRRLDLHSYYYHLHQLHDKPANINMMDKCWFVCLFANINNLEI